jgi:hypothetical protein
MRIRAFYLPYGSCKRWMNIKPEEPTFARLADETSY